MLNRLFTTIFFGVVLFSPTNNLFSDEIVSITDTDTVSEVLKDYYSEFSHDVVHGEQCQCSSAPQKKELLGTYYSEFSD